MQSDSGEESDVVFTQRSSARHRVMAGRGTSPEEDIQPASSAVQHEEEGTGQDEHVEEEGLPHYVGLGEEVDSCNAEESDSPWNRIALRVMQESERENEEEQNRGERQSSFPVEEARFELSALEPVSKSRGLKRGRVGAEIIDKDADLDSVGEVSSTSSEEGKGDHGGVSTAAKRQHTA